MHQPVLRPAQTRLAHGLHPEISRAMVDLALYGAAVIAPCVAMLRDHPAWLDDEEARPLLAHLLKTAMGPLEREGDWEPIGLLLQALDPKSAAALQGVLLLPQQLREPLDLSLLPDSTAVVLAGLIDAAQRPGRALALLDDLEIRRHDPRFMALSWKARCHILRISPGIEALWTGSSEATPRAAARWHAQERRMEEALMALTAALEQAASIPLASATMARRGIGADLAVLAVWLAAHGQGALLESYRPIARHLASHPMLAREALDVLLRAPATPAWEPLRESWLEAARRYFQRFMAAPHRAQGQGEPLYA